MSQSMAQKLYASILKNTLDLNLGTHFGQEIVFYGTLLWDLILEKTLYAISLNSR
jgi:hypothetical protein